MLAYPARGPEQGEGIRSPRRRPSRPASSAAAADPSARAGRAHGLCGRAEAPGPDARGRSELLRLLAPPGHARGPAPAPGPSAAAAANEVSDFL